MCNPDNPRNLNRLIAISKLSHRVGRIAFVIETGHSLLTVALGLCCFLLIVYMIATLASLRQYIHRLGWSFEIGSLPRKRIRGLLELMWRFKWCWLGSLRLSALSWAWNMFWAAAVPFRDVSAVQAFKSKQDGWYKKRKSHTLFMETLAFEHQPLLLLRHEHDTCWRHSQKQVILCLHSR
jgi:hypothetical protein